MRNKILKIHVNKISKIQNLDFLISEYLQIAKSFYSFTEEFIIYLIYNFLPNSFISFEFLLKLNLKYKQSIISNRQIIGHHFYP